MFSVADPPAAEASHNRASQITWTRDTQTGEVLFDLNFVARWSYYNNEQSIVDPGLNFGDGSSVTPTFEVKSFDIGQDIAVLKSTVRHKYPSSGGPYIATLSSCCRLSAPSHINNPDGNYAISTLVDPTQAGSPKSSFAPIVDCPVNGICTFTVNATDPLGRTLSWRLATNSDPQLSSFRQPGAPDAPNAATIDRNSGRYTWDTTGARLNSQSTGMYSSQVVVEALSNNTVVGSVSVDFLIRLGSGTHLAPPCLSTGNNPSSDDDGDGLCDNWETTGIPLPDGQVFALYDENGNGTIDAGERPDPTKKDIYVEVDYMEGRGPIRDGHGQHLTNVRKAFADHGIRLHTMVADRSIPFAEGITMECDLSRCPDTSDRPRFDTLKDRYFGTPAERELENAEFVRQAKKMVFHYAIFANKQWSLKDGQLASSGSSGKAEIVGNDMIITLGDAEGQPTLQAKQDATFMHELGHNLGLYHGGGDVVNCKPNYISIMNYTRQFAGYVPKRRLDYSDRKLPSLRESQLNERSGLSLAPDDKTSAAAEIAYFNGSRIAKSSAKGPINWNNSWGILGFEYDRDAVSVDVNNIQDDSINCGSRAADETLNGFSDWDNLKFDFRASGDYLDGIHTTLAEDETPSVNVELAARDTDLDGADDDADNCPTIQNPDQIDADFSGFGDACEPPEPDRVSVGGINYPEDGSTVENPVQFQGTGRTGATVEVREDGQLVCRAIVDDEELWSCDETRLSYGFHNLRFAEQGTADVDASPHGIAVTGPDGPSEPQPSGSSGSFGSSGSGS